MDNDTLINQARQLYAVLIIQRYSLAITNARTERLDKLILSADCRYVRRLNRCAICYQHRLYDCNREIGKNHTKCKRRFVTDSFG